MKKQETQQPVAIAYEVKALTFSPPGLLDGSIPSFLTASFYFIEHEQLGPRIAEIYEPKVGRQSPGALRPGPRTSRV